MQNDTEVTRRSLQAVNIVRGNPVCLRETMRPSLMLLFFGLVNSAQVKRNVIFQKVNEITTTGSRWLITFVIDLDPYEKLLSTLRDDFKIVEESIQTLETMYATTNSRGFLNPETFLLEL